MYAYAAIDINVFHNIYINDRNDTLDQFCTDCSKNDVTAYGEVVNIYWLATKKYIKFMKTTYTK